MEIERDRDHLPLRRQEDKHLAEDTGVANLGDVTADMLDEWRGLWGSNGEKKYNRIGLSSQSAFLGYLKRFFRYAVRAAFLARSPAQELDPISKSKKRTQVLSLLQFQELLAAIPRYTAARRGMMRGFGAEIRALLDWSDLNPYNLDVLRLPEWDAPVPAAWPRLSAKLGMG